MANIMTVEQMQKGSQNLNTLEAWVEGAPNTTVTTPNGRVMPTMSTAVAKLTTDGIMQDNKTQRQINAELVTTVNSVSGGYFKAFDTLANLNAATGMTTGQVAKVMSDTAANNGDYRYNGSAWVKGYDALTDAKSYAQNYTDGKFNTNDKTQDLTANITNTGAWMMNGTFSAAYTDDVSTAKIAAKQGDIIKVHTKLWGELPILLVWASDQTTLIHAKRFSTITPDADGESTYTYTMPQDGYFATQKDIKNYKSVNTRLTINEGVPYFLSTKNLTIVNSNLYSTANNIGDKYVDAATAQVKTASGAIIAQIPVTAGKTYAVKSNLFNPDYFVIALRDTNSTTDGATLGRVSLTDTLDSTVKTFTVPANSTATYALINLKVNVLNTASVFAMSEGLAIDTANSASQVVNYNVVDIKARANIAELANRNAQNKSDIATLQIAAKPSPLNNKKWVAIGDSITEKNFRSNLNYHDYVKNDIGTMMVYNYGKSGTGFFDRNNVANEITQTSADIDLITVFLGTNDWGNQVAANQKPLGTFLDTGTTTISGCINTLLSGLIAKFYNKKIAVFTPLPRSNNWGSNASNNAYGYTLEQLANLIKQYCAHYSLPCLDLYHQSNLSPWDSNANSYYFTYPNGSPDGLHPNDAGHRVLADKIKKFLEGV